MTLVLLTVTAVGATIVNDKCHTPMLSQHDRNLFMVMSSANPTKVKFTVYADWLNKSVAAKAEKEPGYDLAELGRRVKSDYNYMWKLSDGMRKRPGYDLAVRIGEELDDLDGSLKAADWVERKLFKNTVPEGMKRFIVGEIDGQPVVIEVSENASEDDLNRIRLAMQIALASPTPKQ